jgi:Zn-dependent protease with chaperone function
LRRLRNVVEEIAIASGVPVPEIYVLDQEPGINAFAAGFSPADAAVAVTRGALEKLNRDELQGVIAHEFSHILNGDMRLNARLVAVLHGMLVIGLAGRALLPRRSVGIRGSSGLSMLFGSALVAIGSLGTLAGNLIKAAVSRQREFLADAAAVQFTRNPAGIAAALKRIGGLTAGSRLHGAGVEAVSHMFFGAVRAPLFDDWLSTHPPLEQRIRAVEPWWDGNMLRPRPPRRPRHVVAVKESIPWPGTRDDAGVGSPGGAAQEAAPAVRADDAADAAADAGADAAAGTGSDVDRVGQPDAASLAGAHTLVQGIPAALSDAAHDVDAAELVLYALLRAADGRARSRQDALLDQALAPGLRARLEALVEATAGLAHDARMPLVTIAASTLAGGTGERYRRVVDTVAGLAGSDGRVDLFEWMLHAWLLRTLRGQFEPPRPVQVRYRRVTRVPDACAVLLGALARVAQPEPARARAAFDAAIASLGIARALDAAPDPNQRRLSAAMRQLGALHPLARPALLKAAVIAMRGGGSAGRDLLRVFAAILDCPIPLADARPPGAQA